MIGISLQKSEIIYATDLECWDVLAGLLNMLVDWQSSILLSPMIPGSKYCPAITFLLRGQQ